MMRNIIRLVLPVAVLTFITGMLPVLPTDIGRTSQLAQLNSVVGGSGGVLNGNGNTQAEQRIDQRLEDLRAGGSLTTPSSDPFYFQVITPTAPTTPSIGGVQTGGGTQATGGSQTTGASSPTVGSPSTPSTPSAGSASPSTPTQSGAGAPSTGFTGSGAASALIPQQFQRVQTPIVEAQSLGGFVPSFASDEKPPFDLDGCLLVCEEVFQNGTNECTQKGAKEDSLGGCMRAVMATKVECDRRCRAEAEKKPGSGGSSSSGSGAQAVTAGGLQVWIPVNTNLVTLGGSVGGVVDECGDGKDNDGDSAVDLRDLDCPGAEGGNPDNDDGTDRSGKTAQSAGAVVLLPGNAVVYGSEKACGVNCSSVQIAPVAVKASRAIEISQNTGAVLDVQNAGALLDSVKVANNILGRQEVSTVAGTIVVPSAKSTALNAIGQGLVDVVGSVSKNITNFLGGLLGGDGSVTGGSQACGLVSDASGGQCGGTCPTDYTCLAEEIRTERVKVTDKDGYATYVEKQIPRCGCVPNPPVNPPPTKPLACPADKGASKSADASAEKSLTVTVNLKSPGGSIVDDVQTICTSVKGGGSPIGVDPENENCTSVSTVQGKKTEDNPLPGSGGNNYGGDLNRAVEEAITGGGESLQNGDTIAAINDAGTGAQNDCVASLNSSLTTLPTEGVVCPVGVANCSGPNVTNIKNNGPKVETEISYEPIDFKTGGSNSSQPAGSASQNARERASQVSVKVTLKTTCSATKTYDISCKAAKGDNPKLANPSGYEVPKKDGGGGGGGGSSNAVDIGPIVTGPIIIPTGADSGGEKATGILAIPSRIGQFIRENIFGAIFNVTPETAQVIACKDTSTTVSVSAGVVYNASTCAQSESVGISSCISTVVSQYAERAKAACNNACAAANAEVSSCQTGTPNPDKLPEKVCTAGGCVSVGSSKQVRVDGNGSWTVQCACGGSGGASGSAGDSGSASGGSGSDTPAPSIGDEPVVVKETSRTDSCSSAGVCSGNCSLTQKFSDGTVTNSEGQCSGSAGSCSCDTSKKPTPPLPTPPAPSLSSPAAPTPVSTPPTPPVEPAKAPETSTPVTTTGKACGPMQWSQVARDTKSGTTGGGFDVPKSAADKVTGEQVPRTGFGNAGETDRFRNAIFDFYNANGKDEQKTEAEFAKYVTCSPNAGVCGASQCAFDLKFFGGDSKLIQMQCGCGGSGSSGAGASGAPAPTPSAASGGSDEPVSGGDEAPVIPDEPEVGTAGGDEAPVFEGLASDVEVPAVGTSAKGGIFEGLSGLVNWTVTNLNPFRFFADVPVEAPVINENECLVSNDDVKDFKITSKEGTITYSFGGKDFAKVVTTEKDGKKVKQTILLDKEAKKAYDDAYTKTCEAKTCNGGAGKCQRGSDKKCNVCAEVVTSEPPAPVAPPSVASTPEDKKPAPPAAPAPVTPAPTVGKETPKVACPQPPANLATELDKAYDARVSAAKDLASYYGSREKPPKELMDKLAVAEKAYDAAKKALGAFVCENPANNKCDQKCSLQSTLPAPSNSGKAVVSCGCNAGSVADQPAPSTAAGGEVKTPPEGGDTKPTAGDSSGGAKSPATGNGASTGGKTDPPPVVPPVSGGASSGGTTPPPTTAKPPVTPVPVSDPTQLNECKMTNAALAAIGAVRNSANNGYVITGSDGKTYTDDQLSPTPSQKQAMTQAQIDEINRVNKEFFEKYKAVCVKNTCSAGSQKCEIKSGKLPILDLCGCAGTKTSGGASNPAPSGSTAKPTPVAPKTCEASEAPSCGGTCSGGGTCSAKTYLISGAYPGAVSGYSESEWKKAVEEAHKACESGTCTLSLKGRGVGNCKCFGGTTTTPPPVTTSVNACTLKVTVNVYYKSANCSNCDAFLGSDHSGSALVSAIRGLSVGPGQRVDPVKTYDVLSTPVGDLGDPCTQWPVIIIRYDGQPDSDKQCNAKDAVTYICGENGPSGASVGAEIQRGLKARQ